MPVVLGVLGVIVGGVVRAISDQILADRTRAWSALGYTMLFGIFVVAVPVGWSLVLLCRRPFVSA